MFLWDGKNIYFMGFMAAGKSKVGKELAHILGWPFADTDDLVEERAGIAIDEIFMNSGESEFRRIEKDVIKKIAQNREWIVSLGGGAVIDEENWRMITDTGITICLHATPYLLHKRISRKDNRPLMKNRKDEALRERIAILLSEREPAYKKAQYHFESREEVSAYELAVKIYKQLQDEV